MTVIFTGETVIFLTLIAFALGLVSGAYIKSKF